MFVREQKWWPTKLVHPRIECLRNPVCEPNPYVPRRQDKGEGEHNRGPGPQKQGEATNSSGGRYPVQTDTSHT